jgi:hypothetical protein
LDDLIELTFTTVLSNGKAVPVWEGGEEQKVTKNNIEEYKRCIIKIKSNEAKIQMDAIKEGFNLIIPLSAVKLLTWKQLENRICGSTQISIEDLKSIAQYDNCSADDKYVMRFWRVFESFTHPQRSAFLKFTWGRANLPPKTELEKSQFTIYLEDKGSHPDHDKSLPKAHTCYFQIDLPRYSTDEICSSKILYAIETCGEIDDDFDVSGDDYMQEDSDDDWRNGLDSSSDEY